MSRSPSDLTYDAATARALQLRDQQHNSYKYISDYMLRRHGLRLTADEWRKRCGRPARTPRPSKAKTKTEPIRFPIPAQAFTRAYRRALDAGVDVLEERDAANECRHGRLPGYPCGCWGPVKQAQKVREAA